MNVETRRTSKMPDHVLKSAISFLKERSTGEPDPQLVVTSFKAQINQLSDVCSVPRVMNLHGRPAFLVPIRGNSKPVFLSMDYLVEKMQSTL